MKRLLAFLLLLALGFGALVLALGDDAIVKEPSPRDDAPREPTTPGVPVQQGSIGGSVTLGGEVGLPLWRDVPQADGSIRSEEVLVLRARDSRLVDQGRQQLDDVRTELFDDGVLAATITARQAFVQLRTDRNGRLSLEEGKDVDGRDVVVVGAPSSRLAGLRLELGNARLRIENDEIVLTTPRDQPVTMVFEGEQPITLRGRGAQAQLPRGKNSARRRADVEILRDPVLTTQGLEVRASGRMHFVEDLDTGAGRLTLDDDVVFTVQRADVALLGSARAKAGRDAPATVRGDQFIGWLLRAPGGERKGGTSRGSWQQLVLTGAPAIAEIAGLRIRTPRVTVQPGALGDAFLLTAHGGESVVEQTERRPGSKFDDLLVGRGARRVHVVRAAEHVGAFHRAFGFPRWSMRPFEDLQLVVAEGAAALAGGGRRVDASDGVRIWRRDGSEHAVVRGLGAVRVHLPATPREPELTATGNDGFLLTSDAEGETDADGTRTELLRLQLGPPETAATWRQHAYEVRHGDATLRGTGSCSAERAGERLRLHLRGPEATTVAAWPTRGLVLKGVHELHAELVGEDLVAMDAAGWPVDLLLRRDGEHAQAQGPRVVQIGPRSLRLLPADAAAPGRWAGLADTDREPLLRYEQRARGAEPAQRVEVRGPSIDVHHVGARDVLVDALQVGDALPRVHAHVGQSSTRTDTTVVCSARRLRVLPFLLPPEMRGWLTGQAGGALPTVAFRTLGAPWLLVDDVADFELEDARQGHVAGAGRRLLVSHGGRAALFVGDPESLTPAEVRRTHGGRVVTMRGARVRAFEDDGARLQALGTFEDRSEFVPPTLTLRTPQRAGLLSNMQASCRGDIEVLADAITFGGPVTMHTLDRDGAVDPRGMRIDARVLRMGRHAESGDVVLVTGADVVLDWPRLRARCADVEMDLRRHVVLAVDPAEAVVTLPDGREVRSPRIEFDYETLALRTSRGRVSEPTLAEGGR